MTEVLLYLLTGYLFLFCRILISPQLPLAADRVSRGLERAGVGVAGRALLRALAAAAFMTPVTLLVEGGLRTAGVSGLPAWTTLAVYALWVHDLHLTDNASAERSVKAVTAFLVIAAAVSVVVMGAAFLLADA